jgi:hypothetical protein
VEKIKKRKELFRAQRRGTPERRIFYPREQSYYNTS